MTDPQASLSRRQLLHRGAVGAGLFTVGGGLLAACGSDDDSSSPAKASGSAARVATTSSISSGVTSGRAAS